MNSKTSRWGGAVVDRPSKSGSPSDSIALETEGPPIEDAAKAPRAYAHRSHPNTSARRTRSAYAMAAEQPQAPEPVYFVYDEPDVEGEAEGEGDVAISASRQANVQARTSPHTEPEPSQSEYRTEPLKTGKDPNPMFVVLLAGLALTVLGSLALWLLFWLMA